MTLREFIAMSLIATLIILAAAAILSTPAMAATTCGGASWYGPGFHGKRTASGTRFNQNAMTAAHKTLPFGTRLRVTYRGKSVVVRITDRGPYVGGRVIDLSRAAAARIGLIGPGHGRVCLERLG